MSAARTETDTDADTDETPYALPGGVLRRSLTLIGRGIAAAPRASAIGIGASAVYGLGQVASGWALGRVTDEVALPALRGEAVTTRDIWLAGLALVGIGLVTAVSVALRRIYAGMAALDIQAHHRRKVTRQYLRLPMSWHRRHPAGQLLSNANSDAEAAGMVFVPLPFALGVIVMIVVAGVAMIAADWVVGLIGMSVLPLVLAVNVVYRRYMSPAITIVQAERANVADVAHESFEAATVVKALGTEAQEEQRFEAVADDLRRANVKVGRIRSLFDPVIDLLPALATLAVLLVGAHRVDAGLVRTGDIVTAAYLLTIMTFPVRAIGFVLGDLPRSLVGHERISRVVDARGYLHEGGSPVPGDGGLRLEADGVGLVVHDSPGAAGVRLLEDVSFAVEPGTTLALVGSTGAGKSTLVDVLTRMTDPTEGAVRYDGVDLRELTDAARTGAVALVAQSTFVFEDSIRANVALAGETSDEEVWAALRTAQADGFVRALPEGLDTVVGERGASLSGGQRQRLAIARALVHRPRLLILDDATSAVDPAVEQQILAGLRERTGGATVLMVAYRTSTIVLADAVVHLEGGRMIDAGTHAELLGRDPGYREIVTAYAKDRDRREREGEAR